MDRTRTLWLLRHCETEAVRPGAPDLARSLTERGHRQAATLGARLREQGRPVELVLCSPAVRTRQTVAGLALGAETEVVVENALYEAGGDSIVELVRSQDDAIHGILVVGHAPGIPAALYDLADPATSDPAARRAVADRYPAGTLAVLEVTGSWSDLASVRLTDAMTT